MQKLVLLFALWLLHWQGWPNEEVMIKARESVKRWREHKDEPSVGKQHNMVIRELARNFPYLEKRTLYLAVALVMYDF